MGVNPKLSNLQAGAMVCAMLWAACAWGQTVRHHQQKQETDPSAAQIAQAEAAIEKQDYAAAEKLLLPVVASNPKNALAWYDLGYVYKATKRPTLAIDAYRKSVAATPDLYEANLGLGLMLAEHGNSAEATTTLKTALKQMPQVAPASQKASAWMALGHLQEQSSPNDAASSFRKAAELLPKESGPRVAAARAFTITNDVPGAEREYKEALKIDPNERAALTGLVDLYRENNRPAEAGLALRNYAKQFPDDPKAHLMLGQALLKAGDSDAALAEFDAGLKQSPHDAELLHQVAAMCASLKKYDIAAARYAELNQAVPNNAQYHYEYGVVLMQLHKFPEAQEQLVAALKRDGKMLQAYGDLAVTASENKQYALAINVLDARAKLSADTPATYFLRATAYDNLKAFPQAAENYHKFLETSNGQFSDNEWKARHRLIAIEPSTRKKK
jgi:tetratricopeptide (TPR) repeat protein